MDIFEYYLYYLIGSTKKDHLTIIAGSVYSTIYNRDSNLSKNIPFMYAHKVELKKENALMLFEMLTSDNKETKQLAIETFKQEAYAQEQSQKKSQKENI